MCFYISERLPDPIIAENDLICYKIGVNKKFLFFFHIFQPPYRFNFRYLLNKKTKKVKLVSSQSKYVNEGYHAYVNQAMCVSGYEFGIFIIPKGTKFYFNPGSKECVSEQLIYKGPLTMNLYQKLLDKGCKNIYFKPL